MDEPVTNPLTLSMLNTSSDSIIGKTDIEEGSINDQSFGDLSMISLDEQDGPNQLDITDTNMEPLTLSMLNTSQNNTSQKNSVLDETDNESFGGKGKTRSKKQRGGVRNINGELIDASSYGHPKIVKNLLDEGADVNALDGQNHPALFWASFNGHAKVVEILLDYGADVTIKDVWGHTALYWANFNGHKKVVELLNRHKERQEMVDRRNLNEAMARTPVERNFGSHRMPTDVTRYMGDFLSPKKGGKRKSKKSKRTTKRTTKRGGIRTRRDPKSSEKGQSYKATQITKKNTINKRNMNRQTMDELDNLFQNITIAQPTRAQPITN